MARWLTVVLALGALSACTAEGREDTAYETSTVSSEQARAPQGRTSIEVRPPGDSGDASPLLTRYVLQGVPGLSEVWGEVEARVAASRSTGLLFPETRAAVVLLLAADYARQWDEMDCARRLAIYSLASIEGEEILDAVMRAPVLWPYVEKANHEVPPAFELLDDEHRWKESGFQQLFMPDNT